MELTPAQTIIAKDKTRFRVLVCGRKFGKTELAIWEIFAKAIQKNGNKVVYIASNFPEVRDVAWERLKKITKGAWVSNPNETRLEVSVWTQEGGISTIQLKSWEAVENLRGMEFDLAVLDEIQNYKNFWIGWQEVLRPTLTPRKGSALFMGTPKGFDHVYDLFNLELEDKEFKAFRFTTYDNPFIPREEIEAAKKQLPPDVFAQEYLAEFRKAQGLVYKEFSREKHLYDELPQGEYEKVAGVDFGYINPAAVLDIRIKREGMYEVYFVEDEWYQTEKTDAQIAEYVAACGFSAVYPDPQNRGGIQELINRHVNVRPVIKGKDSIVMGIQRIRELLIAGRLKVNKRCKHLISEFESYRYKDVDQEDRNRDEKPLKANDHALDALRYVIMMRKQYEEPIIDIKQPPYESPSNINPYPFSIPVTDENNPFDMFS